MKIGRNDPCKCGSGKKYKKCCLPKDEQEAAEVREAVARSQDTGWIRGGPERSSPAPTPEQVAQWPVRKAWVPVPEVFAVTGYGAAGVLRAKENGEFTSAYFLLRLTIGGLFGTIGGSEKSEADCDELLTANAGSFGACEPGDPEYAATLVWACHDYAAEIGDPVPPESYAGLALLPRPALTPRLSLDDVAGVGKKVPSALVDLVRAHPQTNTSDNREIAILTEARFGLTDPAATVEAIRAMKPDFDARDDGGFDFTRPSAAHHTAPLSRIAGRRVQGNVRVEGDELIATAGISMMARLLTTLYARLPQRPVLRSAQWGSPTLRRQWSWSAAEEPLALR